MQTSVDTLHANTYICRHFTVCMYTLARASIHTHTHLNMHTHRSMVIVNVYCQENEENVIVNRAKKTFTVSLDRLIKIKHEPKMYRWPDWKLAFDKLSLNKQTDKQTLFQITSLCPPLGYYLAPRDVDWVELGHGLTLLSSPRP